MNDPLLFEVKSTSAKHNMFKPGCTVLAAVSGGLDSMCLLHSLCSLSETFGIKVAAAHFNHRLRGEESDRDEQFVMSYCKEHAIPCLSSSGDVKGYALSNKCGIEESARKLRYEFLNSAARSIGADYIATAHTADDNAETVLLNLTRGTGLTGLCGIPVARDNIIRPMLSVTRSDVERYAEKHGIPHVEDSTNEQDDYSRNKIRHHVIPVLKELNAEFAAAVSRCTDLLTEDAKYLDSLADSFIHRSVNENRVVASELAALPFPIASRVIRKLCPCALSENHVRSALRLCKTGSPSASVDLPGITLRREYEYLIFGENFSTSFQPFSLQIGQTVINHELGLKFSLELIPNSANVNKSFNIFLFKYDRICGNITVRPRSAGDKICFLNRSGTKSLKKLFIDSRIPASQRDLIPVIADDSGVMAVYGFGINMPYAAFGNDTVLKLEIEELSCYARKRY